MNPHHQDPSQHDAHPHPAAEPDAGEAVGRRPWTPPAVEALPPLKELTLQTGDPIGGSESVFP